MTECGELLIREGGESATFCREPSGHEPKHSTMSYDEYRARRKAADQHKAKQEEKRG